jgi:hypothetical protein
MFKFRDDNRASINQAHVEKLKKSISKRNLLHLKPIQVNGEMDIIDGQHRVLAAKDLGVDIWYEVDGSLAPEDIILMNISKSWQMLDYLNYYVKHNYPEYVKLQKFMKEKQVSIQVALRLMSGTTLAPKQAFKDGEFVFNQEVAFENLDLCQRTIDLIQRLKGNCAWTSSSKFWQSLLIVFRHPSFSEKKWFANLEMLINKITQKANSLDYINSFITVHNYRNQNRIDDLGDGNVD